MFVLRLNAFYFQETLLQSKIVGTAINKLSSLVDFGSGSWWFVSNQVQKFMEVF
jgi:hypothetical protein